MKFILSIVFSIALLSNINAQITGNKIISIQKAETNFQELIKEKGLSKAYLAVVAKDGVTFKPALTRIDSAYQNESPTQELYFRYLQTGKIARSGDLGFTTGPYKYINPAGKETYGHYLSIWATNNKRDFKMALDINISNPKETEKKEPVFTDPVGDKYNTLMGKQKIKMREDIVLSSDKTMGATIKAYGLAGFREFYAKESMLYFPGYQPIEGRQNAINFIREQDFKIRSNPLKAARAFSGDLAYSYGEAVITEGIGLGEMYNYVRVWEIGQDSKWYVILDVYTKAE